MYLHVGSPKTGTTHLQGLLDQHRPELRSAGICYPGTSSRDHFLAALDLRGMSFGGHVDLDVPGAWQRLVDEVRAWPGPSIVSHEILAGADEEEIRRAVDAFAPADVHVVVTARNLAAQLTSSWQEHVKNRKVTRWCDYVGAVRQAASAPSGQVSAESTVGGRFWRAQDPADILRRWGRAVPVERLHLITVPPASPGEDLIWGRFAEVVGIPLAVIDGAAARAVPSLGLAETELLRRINERVDPAMPWPSYRALVKRFLAEHILVRSSAYGAVQLSDADLRWVQERSHQLVSQVRASGCDIAGDLGELCVALPESPVEVRSPDELGDAELVAAALPAITACVTELVDLRPAPHRPSGAPKGPVRRRLSPSDWRQVARAVQSTSRRVTRAVQSRSRRGVDRLRSRAAERRELSAAHRRAGRSPTVYIHIGLPKTGTTFLQSVLAANRPRLIADGVHYPEGRFGGHFFAALDLLGIAFRGHRYDAAAGAWEAVAGQVRSWPGVSVVSHEVLFRANERHVRKAAASLQPADVRVVLTVRDLARQLPAVWQERLKLGHQHTWSEFLDAVVAADTGSGSTDLVDDEQEAPYSADDVAGPDLRRMGRIFWRGHDAAAVARRWANTLSAEKTNIVTVPSAGADQELLWERFARVIGLDSQRYPLPERGANTSLGPAEAELLRRLNAELTELLSWEDYERHAKWDLAEHILSARPRQARMILPDERRSWVEQRSQRVVAELQAAGYPVSGDLADLLPEAQPELAEARSPDQTDEAEVLDAALDALVGLVQLRGQRLGRQ